MKKILFIAGKPSHGYGAHEHYAGCVLLAKSLESAMPNVDTEVVRDSWPEASQFESVDAIVMYSDGEGKHPVLGHLEQVEDLTNQGVGVVCIHYAVEVAKGPAGDHFLDWIGGYFESHWSVNPHWKAEFTELPEHEITRGVQPFDSQDEWYYHMRFRPDMENVTPILTAVPPAHTLSRPDGPHEGNPHVRAKAGQPQHVAWAVERADGGRGFGFTGGHFHWNWGNPDFRRIVLNAIVWTAGAEVPEGGVSIDALNLNDLRENQDFEEPGNFDAEQVREVHGVDGN
ncbi:MAG: ThuA domain-containing protein [Pirellulaceae bacterium]